MGLAGFYLKPSQILLMVSPVTCHWVGPQAPHPAPQTPARGSGVTHCANLCLWVVSRKAPLFHVRQSPSCSVAIGQSRVSPTCTSGPGCERSGDPGW